MLKHTFECEKCHHEMNFRVYQISAVVKCKNCGKEFLVIKNKVALVFEIAILFMIAAGIRSALYESNQTQNIFIEILLVLLLLLGLNLLFDLFFVKVIKWKKYYGLVERAMPIPPNKKT